MSLTSFIALPEVKAKFKEEFLIPKTVLPSLPCCEPRTKNYSLIGTAFDYLVRFRLQYDTPYAVVKPWVARYAAKQAEYILDGGNSALVDLDRALFDRETAELVHEAWEEAQENHENYLASGMMTDELLRSSLKLAQMDFYFRSGLLPNPFGEINDEDVEDLRALLELIPMHSLASENLCLLNPVFGFSTMIGGADVDLVLDNTIIDFKTTKSFKVTRDYLNQLLGYYTLHTIGGIVGAPDGHQIDTIGIYFSRHGYLHTWPISDFVNPETFPAFQKWFVKTVKYAFK